MLELDDDAIARYARQIVVPGIGAAGQRRLLAATVRIVGHPRGRLQAELYLRAAGVNVAAPGGEDRGPAQPIGLAIAADAGCLDDAARTALLRSGVPVCWYTVDAGGFTSGVHPGSPLPGPGCRTASPADHAEHADDALHDAAACDAASVACAILVGLPWHDRPFRFDV